MICHGLQRKEIRLRRKDNYHKIVGGMEVEVRNGDFNGAMRRFKKKVAESGLLQEIRDRQFYTKPSEKRKTAKAAGRSRWLRKLSKIDPEQAENLRRKR